MSAKNTTAHSTVWIYICVSIDITIVSQQIRTYVNEASHQGCSSWFEHSNWFEDVVCFFAAWTIPWKLPNTNCPSESSKPSTQPPHDNDKAHVRARWLECKKKQLKQIMCKSQNPAVQWYVAYSNFLWFTRFTTQTQTQRTKQKQNEQFKFRCFFSCETNIFVAALLPWKSTTNKKTRAFFAFRYSYFYARLFIIVLTSWCCCCRFFVVLVCFDVCV